MTANRRTRHRRRLVLVAAAVWPGLVTPQPAPAQTPLVYPQTLLTSADATADDYFGTSVAVSGDTAVVGAPSDWVAGINSGSAYVFVRSGDVWTQQAKLTPSDGAAGDLFGWTLDISGDTVVVGALYHDINQNQNPGAVYVFVRNGSVWTQQAKLIAVDGDPNDEFGRSVAISGDTIAIGAHHDDSPLQDAGSLYVFLRSGDVWTQQAKLTAADAEAFDFLGGAVDIDGDTVIAGAYHENHAGTASGAAYVWKRSGSTWAQQAKLIASDGTAGDEFGWSVAVQGETAVAGAYRNDAWLQNSGAAYVFIRAGTVWTQQAKLTPAEPGKFDEFGKSVAIDGDAVVVGTPAYDGENPANRTGAAYVFGRAAGLWSQNQVIRPTSLVHEDQFGESVAVDGDTVLVGAPADDTAGGQNAGSALALAPLDCNDNRRPDEQDIASGTSQDCNSNAVPDECDISSGLSTDCDRNGVPDDCGADADGDLIGDACDVCPDTPPGTRVDCHGRPRIDLNGDCLVDGEDLQLIIEELLNR